MATTRCKWTPSRPTDRFAATTRRLGPGRYYVVAYASNGMGLSLGDTLYVTID